MSGYQAAVAGRHLLSEAGSRDKIKEEQELAKSYRLSPLDGVLEREVFITKALIWVPVMPSTVVPREYFGIQVENLTWRRFAFEQAHTTFLTPHRTSGATWQTLKRIAFWQTMKKDFDIWIFHCAVCHQYRTVGTMAPMRSILASVDESLKLPWNDVIIDCQGPFTRSAKGKSYTVSYRCVFLGVCKIEPFERLTKECFLTALVACVMRARRVPSIVRTDRGPEMTSAVMQEFMTLCNAKQFLGAAFTPRHQGPGERKHIVVMQHWLILIHKICRAFPQEWDVLAPVVEYLLDTETGEGGFSAHELQTGYSLLQEPDVTLAPFLVPRGTAQTDIAARLFSNFRELAGILNRHKEEASRRQADSVNQIINISNLGPGEIGFQRMPAKARPSKHLLGEPSAGPYIVDKQSTFSSVKLKDPATGGWVDEGANIPLEQILAGPRRSQFSLEESDGSRSIGQMITGEGGALPPLVVASGWQDERMERADERSLCGVPARWVQRAVSRLRSSE